MRLPMTLQLFTKIAYFLTDIATFKLDGAKRIALAYEDVQARGEIA
jgi:hypothetical protein